MLLDASFEKCHVCCPLRMLAQGGKEDVVFSLVMGEQEGSVDPYELEEREGRSPVRKSDADDGLQVAPKSRVAKLQIFDELIEHRRDLVSCGCSSHDTVFAPKNASTAIWFPE